MLLGGCGQTPGPAPVVSASQPMTITIARGDTLSGIAQAYHVPMRELAEANHLSPPYRIIAGAELMLPAAVKPAAAPPTASTVAAVRPIPAPTAPPPPKAATPAPAPVVQAASQMPPEPLRPSKPPPSPAIVEPKPATATAAVATPSASARGGSFAWPVRGRIVAGYGAGQDGTHNDGINIGAARGTAVEAADGGVVAYAGNELRGYGNLILIKHPNGWISAYAHCESILVKRGEKVARGQVIAHVGATGNVTAPQLHFELRHGDKPVDPRAYLLPLPSAVAGPAQSG
jgi:murein DD-endopeptidase MepM/ murein hydrolase activator NlpD